MENRELTINDYLAILRRRLKIIVIPALLAPVVAFLISYALPAKYESQSLVLVEGQKVAEGYVRPLVKEDVAQRILTLQQQVLSRARLQPVIQRLGLGKIQNLDDTVDEIQKNLSIEPLSGSEIAPSKRPSAGKDDVPGFYLNFTADDPHVAQQLCGEITSMLLEENLRARERVVRGTTDFLSVQTEEAKRSLDDLDARLASFKQQHFGQLPEDEQHNMQILAGLNSQLDSNTQTANRAQQDKSYTESLMAQQEASWKELQTASNPQTLQQQLVQLQSQLVTLQARYTQDHPDVIKIKNDIAQVKLELAAINSPSKDKTAQPEMADVREPPEIQQLRSQIRRYDDAIAQATRDQVRIKNEIKLYQDRLALSPAVDEQYRLLARDYETAQKRYGDLLSKKNESQMQGDLERRQQGEQMTLLNPASLPEKPSFPNRLLFTGGGLVAGLAFGLGMVCWLELRDKSIRTEEDVASIFNCAVLVSVPWLEESGIREKKLRGSATGLSDPV